MPDLQAVFFDLGDTLLDFGPVDTLEMFEQGARLTYAWLADFGQPLGRFSVYHRRQLRAIRWAYFKSRLVRREFNALDVMRRLERVRRRKLTEDQLLELACLWYEPLGRQATAEPNLRETLGELAQRGLKLGVISNTFIPAAALDRHLQREGLLELLPLRTYSCQVGYRKPSPRIFQQALAQAQVAADQAMFVGDSLPADIRGGRRMGMITVLKDADGRHKTPRPVPDHVIRSLAELPAIVAEYA